MDFNNISLSKTNGYNGYYQLPQGVEEQTEVIEEDKTKSNAAKYMIGATALAGVVALGVAGYKGHLGKTVEKHLKNVGESLKNLTKTEPPSIKFKDAEGTTGKLCEISDDLKTAIQKSEGDFSGLETFEHSEFGSLAVLKKFDNGKPQFVADGLHIYELENGSNNIIKQMEKGYYTTFDGSDWINHTYISKISKLDSTNSKKVLSETNIDENNNVISYIKNKEWNNDFRPTIKECYEGDMKTLDSIKHFEYDGYYPKLSFEYTPDGKTLLSKQIYSFGGDIAEEHEFFRGTKKIFHSTYYNNNFISEEKYLRRNGMLDKELVYDKNTYNLSEEYRYYPQPKFRFPWQKKKNLLMEYTEYDPNSFSPKVINTTCYDKKGNIIEPINID